MSKEGVLASSTSSMVAPEKGAEVDGVTLGGRILRQTAVLVITRGEMACGRLWVVGPGLGQRRKGRRASPERGAVEDGETGSGFSRNMRE